MALSRTLGCERLHTAVSAAFLPRCRSLVTFADIWVRDRFRTLEVSPTLGINERCLELRRTGRDVCHFGFGQSPFPVPECARVALAEAAHEKDYLPVAGLPALREAIGKFHQRVDDLNVRGEDVIVGPGSKELLYLLQLVFKGHMIFSSPSWVSYHPQAIMAGHTPGVVHSQAATSRWLCTPQAVRDLCKEHPGAPHAIILNSPGNPHGTAYTEDQLCELAAELRRQGVIVFSDEIYGYVHHTGGHVSIAKFYPEGTIVTNGLSKWCGAGGWRLGYACFPKTLRPLQKAILSAASETYSCVSAPVQYGGIAALGDTPELQDYVKHSRRILRAVGGFVHATLHPTIDVCPPEGGFYLFPDFGRYRSKLAERGITTSVQLCDAILEEANVALLPGSAFLRPPTDLTARLAYVNFDGRKALEAAAKIDDDLDTTFIQTYCPSTYHGALRLRDWVRSL